MGMLHLFPHHRPGGAMFYFLHGHGPGGMAAPVICGVALYLYLAICLYVLARKTGTDHSWMAWIPVLNVYLLCKIGGKPGWWTALLFIPVVNVFFAVLVFMAIAEARGKPYWWGVLIALPLARAVVPGYLAFSGPNVPLQATPTG
jgi:hypothetical protein